MAYSNPTRAEFEAIEALRAKISALPTITEDAAKALPAKPLTRTYHTRILDQCRMLLSALEGEQAAAVVLVKTASGIAIWRKKA